MGTWGAWRILWRDGKSPTRVRMLLSAQPKRGPPCLIVAGWVVACLGGPMSMGCSKALGNLELKAAAQQDDKVLGRTAAVTTTTHIT